MQYPGFVGDSNPRLSWTLSIERLVNWYLDRQGPILLPTPGFSTFAATTNVNGRAALSANGRGFMVFGTGLWEIFENQTATLRGSVVQDNHPATISYNGLAGGQLFITSGNQGYCYVLATNTLTQVLTDKAFQGGMKDGYFLSFDRATGRVFLSDLNDGTSWDPTQYYARSIAPDPWQAMVVGNPEIWMVGEYTSEAWYNSGAFPQPFAPILSSFMHAGTSAPFSVAMAGDAPCWVAQTQEGSGRIVRVTGYTPQTVSSAAVSEALAALERNETLTDAETLIYEQTGHTFANFSFPTANATWTLDLDSGDWHERGRWNAAQSRFDVWQPRVAMFAFGQQLIGQRNSGSVFTMDLTVGTEADGGAIRRLRIPPALRANLRERLIVDRLQLQLDTGVGVVTGQGQTPSAVMRSTTDGKTWSSTQARSVGRMGKYSTQVFWNRCGGSLNLWAPEIVVSDPVPFRISGAEVEGSGFKSAARAA